MRHEEPKGSEKTAAMKDNIVPKRELVGEVRI
jgi:hypothetical protein